VKIGVPKEILVNENRVAITPAWVRTLVEFGNEVYVQSSAGIGSSFHDVDYKNNGATILPNAESIFEKAEIVLKVKQPLKEEIKMLKKGQILFTYLHLAADPQLTEDLIKSGAHCIAYETIEESDGRLPLIRPMSEISVTYILHATSFLSICKPTLFRSVTPSDLFSRVQV
jgi:alanine dehydrogenase